MKILTAWQKSVLSYMQRSEIPLTVREITEDFDASTSSVRSVLKTLEWHGCVERRGVALTGGTTWVAVSQARAEES